MELKNDAVDNLLGSLLVAGHYNIPEVTIFFNNKLLRGNRSTKENTNEMEAFGSPNLPPLGTMGVNFEIRWDMVQRHAFGGKMTAFTNMSGNISLISISPCLNLKVVESILMNSEAIIIEAYGMGNIPSNNAQLLNLIKNALSLDKIIVITS